MYLVFTPMPGESYHSWLRSFVVFVVCLSNAFNLCAFQSEPFITPCTVQVAVSLLVVIRSSIIFLFTRQLEAIIRIAESQAKMRLAAFATDADVDEALRLFQVSTLDAATSGNLAGEEECDAHSDVLLKAQQS